MIPISAQLYSVREEAARDLKATIAEVAGFGYQGVEFAGFHGHDPVEIAEWLRTAGIRCSGTHTGLTELDDERFAATVAAHQTLGTEFVIIPWMPQEAKTPDALPATLARLSDLTHRLRAEGLSLGFHAHDADMKPREDGPSLWTRIAEGTPEAFVMQYDTSNGVAGGADPVQPIRDFPGRSRTVHVKETDGRIIGEGDVPWEEVFAACESVGGTEWYVVEHESASGRDAIEALRLSLDALRARGKR